MNHHHHHYYTVTQTLRLTHIPGPGLLWTISASSLVSIAV